MERAAAETAAGTEHPDAFASAIAMTALAASNPPTLAGRALALRRHPVTARVAGLLHEPVECARPAWVLVGAAIAASAAQAWALHDTGRFFEAARLLSQLR